MSTINLRPDYGRLEYVTNGGSSSIASMAVQLRTDKFEIRDDINDRGAEYADDYSANYTNRSLVDKEYVDNQLMWDILPADTGTGKRIQPKDNSVRQIFVQRDDNNYTQFKVRNNNDTGNGAGAIIF